MTSSSQSSDEVGSVFQVFLDSLESEESECGIDCFFALAATEFAVVDEDVLPGGVN